MTAGASRHGAAMRHHLWRLVFASTGGLTVTGPTPSGPAVLVVNHSSHADTAAVMAAVPASGRPVFAAAADYWFASPVRRFLVTTLAAAVPVERNADGAYAALLAASAPVAAEGGIVIVYPEGTRTVDGTMSRFASGAVRLAADLDVPVMPAALLGTKDVLPKHGRFQSVPVEIRFGPPVSLDPSRSPNEQASALRAVVLALRDSAPVADPRSPVGERVRVLMDGPAGLVGGFVWGFAEAHSWPVIAEMYLALFAVASPRRMVPVSVAVAAGSVTGLVTNAALARRGVRVPAPLTTPRMHATAQAHLGGGARGIRHQLANGIPVKVYAVEAGLADLSLGRFAVAAGVERTARIVGLGLLGAGVAGLFRAPVRRRYGTYALVAAGVWGVGVRAVVRRYR